MQLEWQAAMRDAISEVLETMFFTLVDFRNPARSGLPYVYGSMISLRNELDRIDITFRVTESFARMLTANLIGTDEDEVEPEDLEDTMKELANMVGGNYQARLSDKAWRLGIPSLIDVGMDTAGSGLDFSYLGDAAGMVSLQVNSSIG